MEIPYASRGNSWGRKKIGGYFRTFAGDLGHVIHVILPNWLSGRSIHGAWPINKKLDRGICRPMQTYANERDIIPMVKLIGCLTRT